MKFSWLQARGRLRGALMDGVRDGNMGGGLASSFPFIGAAYPSFSLCLSRHVLGDPITDDSHVKRSRM